jgi:hypothetical protein
MVDHFGLGYIASGGLSLKLIAPVLEGQRVRIGAIVKTLDAYESGERRVHLDIRAWTGSDTLCAVGTAEARLD